MAILYALIAGGGKNLILAEYAASSGNFQQIAHQLLEKITIEKDTRMTYNADESYSFNYVVKNELIYLCLAENNLGRSIPFVFLDKVQRLFEAQFGNNARETSVPYAFNADFAPVLRKQIEYFSAEGSDKLSEVQQGLDQVKGVMQENIANILERGEKIEHLVVQSEGLMDTSNSFKAGATKLKQTMWWNDMKMKILIGVIIFFVFFFIVANACGGLSFSECG